MPYRDYHEKGKRHISMSRVAPSIVTKNKDETRRKWTTDYARSFQRHEVLPATSQGYRYGGEDIAMIELKEEPFMEEISVHDSEDAIYKLYVSEGFEHLDDEFKNLLFATRMWTMKEEKYWAVKFNINQVLGGMEVKYNTPDRVLYSRRQLYRMLADGNYDVMLKDCQGTKDLQKKETGKTLDDFI